MITTRAFIGIAGMAPAYYAVSAVRGLAATDTDAATFGIFTLSAQLIGTLVWGELTARLHRHWFLVGGPLIGAAGACGALFASSIGSLYPVFIASGLATAAQLMCDMSLPLHLAEGSKVPRGTYIAAYSTLIIPFSITAPIIGGLLAGATGYPTINLLGIVTYIIAAACGFRFLHRPRHGLTDAP